MTLPYSVMPNLIPDQLLSSVDAVWPDVHWPNWYRYTGKTADKFASTHRSTIPYAIQTALDTLAANIAHCIGSSFVDYDLHGAGMHMLPPGGFLGKHVDAERHPIRPWKRTHSIVSFAETLRDEGALVLLIDGTEHKIFPTRGLTVVFETNNLMHWVEPVHSTYRRTLALFAWEKTDDLIGVSHAQFSCC